MYHPISHMRLSINMPVLSNFSVLRSIYLTDRPRPCLDSPQMRCPFNLGTVSGTKRRFQPLVRSFETLTSYQIASVLLRFKRPHTILNHLPSAPTTTTYTFYHVHAFMTQISVKVTCRLYFPISTHERPCCTIPDPTSFQGEKRGLGADIHVQIHHLLLPDD